MDLVDARNLLLHLGYGSWLETLPNWNRLNAQLLPAIYVSPENKPYMLYINSDGNVMASHGKGRQAIETVTCGGKVMLLQERQTNGRVPVLKQIAYRFTKRISLLYGISFGLALLALALPFYIRAIYNISIPSNSIVSTSWIFIGVLALFGLDTIMRQWRASQLALLSGRIEALLGIGLVEKLFSLDYRQVENLGRSGLYNRMRNLDNLLGYLQGPLALACLDFPFIVIYLGAVAIISGWLVIVPIALMLISGSIVVVLSQYYAGALEINQASGLGIGQAQQELVNRFLELKTSHLEWVWLQKLRGLSAESSASGLTLNRQVGRLQVIVNTTAQLGGVLTLGVGAWLAFMNPANPAIMGNLIASMFFVWRIFSPFQQLMNALLRYSSMAGQYQQIDSFLKLRSTNQQGAENLNLRMRGNLSLNAVALKLGNDQALALTRISLSASPGQILAITGPAGCGKSTTLKVIDQLYPVGNGTIIFDGKDYRQYNTELLQRNISYMADTTELLPGSIWSNLTALNADATEAQVAEICTELGLKERIERLPNGIFTLLDEELLHTLSIGTRKLILLAQAMIKDAAILLIDDISQGLNPEEFERLLALIPRLRSSSITGKDRCVIIATENKLILGIVDRLCILDKGISVFEGTGKELQARMQPTLPMEVR
jgi:ABC-type bacteriocin/lantibiotic exporter with double-glycine peptidase domain